VYGITAVTHPFILIALSATPTFRNRTLQISLSLLSSRNDYRFPAALISQLLSQGRLIEAMSAASSVLQASDMSSSNGSSSMRDRPSAGLVQARRLNPGEDFLALAMTRLGAIRHHPSDSNGHLARLFESVYSFLTRWDPQYLQTISPKTVSPRRLQDDTVIVSSIYLKKRMSRRSSWTCTTIIENWMASKGKAEELHHHYSVASGKAARIVNALSMDSLYYGSVRHDPGNEPVRLHLQKLLGG